MFTSMITVESTKLFRRKLLWVEVAIIVALVGIILVTLSAVNVMPSIPAEEREVAMSILMWPTGMLTGGTMAAANQMGAIMMLVLVGALVTQEYGWGTLALLLSRGVPRPVAFFSKLAIIIAAAVILAITSVLVGAAASAIFTVYTGTPLVLQASDFSTMLGLMVGTVLSLLPYIGLTMLIAVISRSAVPTIGIGIGLLVAESVIIQIFGAIGGVFAQITLYMPLMLSQQFFAPLQGASSPEMLTPIAAALGLIAYGAVFFLIAFGWFQRQDFTA